MVLCTQAAQRKEVKLYYGTRSEAMTPFQQEAAEWTDVQLHNVYSSAGQGYVQVIIASQAASHNTRLG